MRITHIVWMLIAAITCVSTVAMPHSPTPGRVLSDGEAESLVGGGCLQAINRNCGPNSGCTGLITGYCLNGSGSNNPSGDKCVSTCNIYQLAGTCSGG